MMEPITISVICPTIGRPTLTTALSSMTVQAWKDGDEVLLIADRQTDEGFDYIRHQFAFSRIPGKCCATMRATDDPYDYGAFSRNLGMLLAKGKWLVFTNDDDAFAPDAIATIRAAVALDSRPHIFRMKFPDGQIIPNSRCFESLGDQCLVIPNRPGLPQWDSGYHHDNRFAFKLAGGEIHALHDHFPPPPGKEVSYENIDRSEWLHGMTGCRIGPWVGGKGNWRRARPDRVGEPACVCEMEKFVWRPEVIALFKPHESEK